MVDLDKPIIDIDRGIEYTQGNTKILYMYDDITNKHCACALIDEKHRDIMIRNLHATLDR